ncbi:MAG: 3'-5' exonuclease, partial [Deltaproteobacteria bacterium]|nr:3'-5' exonuclease [Deltaproteobacteria bacterium]
MYLFFDTETTGLPRDYNAPVDRVENWPRMVQIAWLLYNDDGEKLDSKDFIIKPEGYTIPKNAVGIHNISTERAMKDGEDLSSVLLQFADRIE